MHSRTDYWLLGRLRSRLTAWDYRWLFSWLMASRKADMLAERKVPLKVERMDVLKAETMVVTKVALRVDGMAENLAE